MSEDCALCTDAPATTRLEAPDVFAGLAVWKADVDTSRDDVVVPLCDTCRGMVDSAVEGYEYVGRGGERTGREQLERLAGDLDGDVIDAASE